MLPPALVYLLQSSTAFAFDTGDYDLPLVMGREEAQKKTSITTARKSLLKLHQPCKHISDSNTNAFPDLRCINPTGEILLAAFLL